MSCVHGFEFLCLVSQVGTFFKKQKQYAAGVRFCFSFCLWLFLSAVLLCEPVSTKMYWGVGGVSGEY